MVNDCKEGDDIEKNDIQSVIQAKTFSELTIVEELDSIKTVHAFRSSLRMKRFV